MADFKTTNTTLSIGTGVHNEAIAKAKAYLADNFRNKYNLDPHFNFLIIAMPGSGLDKVKETLDTYFHHKHKIELTLSSLTYNPKQKFFSIPIVGDEVMTVHKELLDLMNDLREGCIREKDYEKIREGMRDPEEAENIKLYGYPRVLNKFTPHITVGAIGVEEFDPEEITRVLNEMLAPVFDSVIDVTKVEAAFYEDAEIQTDLNFLWKKDYTLS